MTDERDTLGRRIPQFDRVAAGKKAAAIHKEKDERHYSKLGSVGGTRPKRGYFGKLRDDGRIEELRRVTSHNGRGYFGKLKDEGKIEEIKKLARKGQAKSVETIRARKNKSVSGGQS